MGVATRLRLRRFGVTDLAKPATSRYGPRIDVDFRAELGHAPTQAEQSLQVSLGEDATVAQVLHLRMGERLDEVAATGLNLKALLAQQFGKTIEVESGVLLHLLLGRGQFEGVLDSGPSPPLAGVAANAHWVR